MRGATRRHLLALAAVAVLLLPGCDILAAPQPLEQSENIGVDPTGETVDTSTLPPDEAIPDGEPFAAAPAPAPKVTRQPPVPAAVPPSAPGARTYVPPKTSSSPLTGVRTGAAGMVHHHLSGSGGGSAGGSGGEH